MNTCGYEKNWTSFFTNDDPEELQKEYWFSEWYSIVKDISYTPKSYIFDYHQLLDGTIDAFIQKHYATKGGCFARLDPCSAKPDFPYQNANEILSSFESSERCFPYLLPTTKIILRDYLPLNKENEFRCYIHQKQLRGISSKISFTVLQLEEIKQQVTTITFYTDYDDYSIDFVYHHQEEQGEQEEVENNEDENKHKKERLLLVEINTPVWLYASSGLFDLDLPYDREILWGKYQPEILSYPVVMNSYLSSNLQ